MTRRRILLVGGLVLLGRVLFFTTVSIERLKSLWAPAVVGLAAWSIGVEFGAIWLGWGSWGLFSWGLAVMLVRCLLALSYGEE